MRFDTRSLTLAMGALACTAAALAQAPQAGNAVRYWDDPGWKSCLAAFKRTAKMSAIGDERRYVDGKCIAQTGLSPKVPLGQCAMAVNGPSQLRESRGFEIWLVCGTANSTEQIVCTNRKGYFEKERTDPMLGDPRCAGFPDLVSIDMKYGGPHRELDKIFADKPQSPECLRRIKVIRRLESSPRFDTDKAVRVEWADRSDEAMKMGCQWH
jgi:hypothetical protein